jgi:hypothetical protein
VSRADEESWRRALCANKKLLRRLVGGGMVVEPHWEQRSRKLPGRIRMRGQRGNEREDRDIFYSSST